MDDITASHKENVANVEKQYSFWMQKKEEETATFVGEFDEYRDRTKKEIKRSRMTASGAVAMSSRSTGDVRVTCM